MKEITTEPQSETIEGLAGATPGNGPSPRPPPQQVPATFWDGKVQHFGEKV